MSVLNAYNLDDNHVLHNKLVFLLTPGPEVDKTEGESREK